MISKALIVQELLPFLRSDTTVWIGFSGGLDSTVLLHAVVNADLPVPVKGLHINHQLSANADSWQTHCEKQARALGVSLVIEKVFVVNEGYGVESSARERRYEVFSSYLKENDIILSAHHRDDVAETLFFRLLRGAGLKGLAGIPKVRALKKGWLIRPFIRQSRGDIYQYAKRSRLQWIEDESNSDQAFDRNFLRQKIFTLLRTRWPQLEKHLADTAVRLAEADQLLGEYAELDFRACHLKRERWGSSLSLCEFKTFNVKRQKHIIREWVVKNNFSLPTAAQLAQLEGLVFARQDAMPVISWGNFELRRYRQKIYLMKKLPTIHLESETEMQNWDGKEMRELKDGSILRCTYQGNDKLKLNIRYRKDAQHSRPEGRNHSQSLKKLLQEYRLEPWLRDRIPLVYSGEELIAVGDLFVCHGIGEKLGGKISFEWKFNENNNMTLC